MRSLDRKIYRSFQELLLDDSLMLFRIPETNLLAMRIMFNLAHSVIAQELLRDIRKVQDEKAG